MMRAAHRKLRGAWPMVLCATVALLALGGVEPARAQQDTTAPVLLDFSISPVVFDSGSSGASLTWCARVQDDVSGIDAVYLTGHCISAGGGVCGAGGVVKPAEAGTLTLDGCSTITFPRFSRYTTWGLTVHVYDVAGNTHLYGSGYDDLCVFGPCTVINRPETILPDADNDGTPDDADNCLDIANADQADTDLDLIGDACDQFPDDRDNEQAQCEADLGQSKRDGKQAARKLERVRADLAAERADADSDGVRDAADVCPGTTIGAAVDAAGCSPAQFCARVDATTAIGRKACKRSDWKNDEPLMNLLTEADCSVDLGPTVDSGDDKCVAVGQ